MRNKLLGFVWMILLANVVLLKETSGSTLPITEEGPLDLETQEVHEEDVDGEKQGWFNPEACAIITCNRRAPHCCLGYHCSLTSYLLGGLGLCIQDQTAQASAATLKQSGYYALGDAAWWVYKLRQDVARVIAVPFGFL